jgi:hypothetical protein
VGRARVNTSKNVRFTSIFESINLLAIEAGAGAGAGAGETIIPGSRVGRSSELGSSPDQVSVGATLPY